MLVSAKPGYGALLKPRAAAVVEFSVESSKVWSLGLVMSSPNAVSLCGVIALMSEREGDVHHAPRFPT